MIQPDRAAAMGATIPANCATTPITTRATSGAGASLGTHEATARRITADFPDDAT
jgi:hypothetical protein